MGLRECTHWLQTGSSGPEGVHPLVANCLLNRTITVLNHDCRGGSFLDDASLAPCLPDLMAS